MDFVFKKRKRSSVKAVYEDDLVTFLQANNLYKPIIEGTYRCRHCGNVITIESLEVVVPTGTIITMVCSNPKCLSQI